MSCRVTRAGTQQPRKVSLQAASPSGHSPCWSPWLLGLHAVHTSPLLLPLLKD